MVSATACAKWFRQAVGLVVAVPAMLIGGAAFVVPASPAWAAPFGCTNDLYYASGTTAISVRKPDGTVQSVSTAPFAPFTIAISPSGVLYAFTNVAGLRNHLFTIADDGTVTDLGVVAGLITTTGVGGAGYTDSGDLLVFQDVGRLFRVDVGALTATQVTTSNTHLPGDLVSAGGELYGSGPNGASLARFDLTTGAVTSVPISNAPGSGYPALWSVDGHIYASVTFSTNLYEIVDFATGTARRVTVGSIAANAGDGASCLTGPSPFLNAADDDFTAAPVRVVQGGAVGNVFDNDTLNGQGFTSGDVTSTITDDDGATGATITAGVLSVAAGTAAGTYNLVYEICQTSNADICDSATATFVVESDPVVANDDAFGKAGGNVLTNDTLDGTTIDPAEVTLSLTNDGGLTGATLDADGKLNVPTAAAPGTYTLTYQVCQNGDPTNCDTATITVTVPDPNADADKDGLPDPKEVALGSNPQDPDTDNDGLKDGREYFGFVMAKKVLRCNRTSAAIGKIRTSLLRPDTDRDGLKDGQEVFGVKIFQIVRTPHGRSYTLGLLKSHPGRPDTDFDGLKDKVEVRGTAAGKFNFAKTNPANCHTDFGLRSDGYELSRGKNPVRAGEY